MAMSDLFSFKSKKEREEQNQAYKQKMFPFGDKQREYDEKMLKDERLSSFSAQENLFLLLMLKEAMMKEEEERTAGLIEWCGGSFARSYSDEAKAYLMALCELELQADCLEHLPDADTVSARAVIVLKEELPAVNKKKGFLSGLRK